MKTTSRVPHLRRLFLYHLIGVLCVTLGTLACVRQEPNSQSVSQTNSDSEKRLSDAMPSPNAQDLEKLKQFSAEDLLKEIRARELEAGLSAPDPVLDHLNEEKRYQPELKAPKRNPLLSGFSTDTLIQVLRFKQQTIYEVDDRKEIFNISDPQIRRAADAVVSLFRIDNVIPLDDGTNSRIARTMFGSTYRLCPTERFQTQPCSAYCSGVLVSPDIVATAGHCVDTPSKDGPPPNRIRFVFGYRMRDAQNPQVIISNSEIYTGKETVARVFTETGPDWALVRLDRAVVGHQPVRIRRSSKIVDAQSVYIIGHPCGLPAKFADGARVKTNSNPDYFVANLDSYTANSGSPVFNRVTHEVEALFVRGELDFVIRNLSETDTCNASLVCPTTGCRGQDCVRTTLFAHLIP